MTRPIRWVFRIALGLFIVVVLVVVAGILFLDTIVRNVLVSRMRESTGMEVKIDSVHVGLRSPTMTIKGFKLYNTAAFGGSLCLDMPELHVEYDRSALRAGTLHLPLMRLNLALINLVEDKHGKSNFEAMNMGADQSASHTNSLNGLDFAGIDTLNLSLGKLHVSNLRSGEEEDVDFAITNQIFHNVKSDADLTGVAALMAIRSSGSAGHTNIDFSELLKTLTSH